MSEARTQSAAAPRKKRVFSGIQPTGVFTLGNYVGACLLYTSFLRQRALCWGVLFPLGLSSMPVHALPPPWASRRPVWRRLF